MKSTFQFDKNDRDAYSIVQTLIDLERTNTRFTIHYRRHDDDAIEKIENGTSESLKWVMAHHFVFDSITRYETHESVDYPDDPLYWNEQRNKFQCGHCGVQFDRVTYFDHWSDSERCRHADIEHERRTK